MPSTFQPEVNVADGVPVHQCSALKARDFSPKRNRKASPNVKRQPEAATLVRAFPSGGQYLHLGKFAWICESELHINAGIGLRGRFRVKIMLYQQVANAF
jgi:hypothetical protein